MQRRQHLTFDDAAVGNATRGLGIHRHRGAVGALGTEARDDKGALGHRIDFAVAGLELGHQQFTTAQALGITQGGHGYVQGLAGLGVGRQGRGHHNRGDILGLGVAVGGHVDAELLQHGAGRLQGKRGLGHLVTGSVQAHHQAKAHQLVGAGTFQHGQVLDPLGVGEAGDQQQRQCRRQCHYVDCSVHHRPAFLKTDSVGW